MNRSLLLLPLLLASLAALAGCGQDENHSAPATPTPVAALPQFAEPQAQYVQVVRAVAPRVVQIQSPIGLGSGVVFDDRGNVVTNAHVVAGARKFIVTLSGGDRHPATLVGADPRHDLAVVHLAGAQPAPAEFGDDARLEVGDLVLAIGNPLGLRSSVTDGIVSALNRSVSEGGGVTLSPVIQTSAAINPGNSGGALVDVAGRVIGIPTLAALDPQMGGAQAQAPGIGFAIPSTTVRSVASGLIAAE